MRLDPRRQPMHFPAAMSGYAPSRYGTSVAPYTATGDGAMTRLLDALILGATPDTPPTKISPPSNL